MRVVFAVLLLTAFSAPVSQALADTPAVVNAAGSAAATTAAPSTATVDPLYVQAMKAYSEKRFPECIDLLERFVLVHPKDPRIHYLLANAYMAAGKLQLAEREYQSCLFLTSDVQLQAYCKTAVSQLRQCTTTTSIPVLYAIPALYGANGAVPAQIGVAPAQAGVGAVFGTPSAGANKLLQLNTGLLQDQEQQLKDRFAQEAQDRARLHNRILSTQIERINQEAEDQIAALGKYSGALIRTRSGMTRSSGGAYQAEIDRIRAEAEAKIARVKIDAGYKSDLSNDELKRQNKCIDSYDDNLRKLLVSDTGSVRVMPTGTCLYVRNYINFGEDTGAPQTQQLQPQLQPSLLQPASMPTVPAQPAVPELRARQFKFKSVK